MPSFDIVSEIDLHELKNAIDNANREIESRFDFRGAQASFTVKDNVASLSGESEFQLQQMQDILQTKAIKRSIDVRAMSAGDVVHTGKVFSMDIEFKQGIDAKTAKSLVKVIKESKMKAQSSIQGEQVRVSAKKRDDLQQVIALVKEQDLGQPFQFNNFRD